MAKNTLTPIQDVTTREFLMDVALAENVFNNNPSSRKTLIRLCYALLNYQRLPDGRFISKDKKVKYLLGGDVSQKDFPDEWQEDYARALDALEKSDVKKENRAKAVAGDDSYPNEADSGEPSEDTSVREAVLPKDV